MPSTAQRALKLCLWFVAIYHLFVGLAVNMSDHFTKVIAATYGATVDWTPQFTYILHPLGAFMIVLGFLAAVAARDPERYDAVIFGFIGLFVIRALHRALNLTSETRKRAVLASPLIRSQVSWGVMA